MRVWHVHGVSRGAVQTLVNGTVNSVVSGSVSGLVHSPVEVQVPFHGLSMGSFQPLAIKLSFTGRGTVLFRPRERPREGIAVNGPVNDPVGGLLRCPRSRCARRG